jgi:ethanolamine utilization protein EutP (predicted NTPase)
MSSFRHIPPDFEQRCSNYWTALVNFYETRQHENSTSWLESVRKSLNLERRDAEAIQAVYLRDHAHMIIPQLLATVEHLNRENEAFRTALRSAQQDMAATPDAPPPAPSSDEPSPVSGALEPAPQDRTDRPDLPAGTARTASSTPHETAVIDPELLAFPAWMPLVHDAINRQQAITRRLGLDIHTKRLEYLFACMQTSMLRLAFVGRFLSGKSTLINALLGEEVLPTGAVSTTAVPIEIAYGPTAHVTAKLALAAEHDGDLTRALDLADLAAYAMKPPVSQTSDDADKRAKPSAIECLRLRWPMLLLQSQALLIDTPGLGQHETTHHQVEQHLAQADVVVYVSRLDSSLTLDEQQWFEQVLTMIGHQAPFFVLTGRDRVSAQNQAKLEERWRSILVEYLRPGLGGLCSMSALDAMEGQIEHDPTRLEQSGIAPFRKQLSQVVLHERWRYKFWRAYYQLRAIAQTIRQNYTELMQRSDTASLASANVLDELTAIHEIMERCRSEYMHLV